MKKFIFAAFFAVATLSVFAQPMNVIDYFRLLPDSLRNYYKLEYQNGQWRVPCLSTAGCFYQSVVDVKNGFIQIVNDVEAQGTITDQFVLFSDLKGNRYLAISRKAVSAQSISTKIGFWLYQNGHWIDVTDHVLPGFSINYFVFPPVNFPRFLSDVFAIWYDLPRYGTEVTVRLDSVDVQDFIDGISKSEQDYKQKLNQYMNFRKHLRYVRFKLKWDRQFGRFIVE